MISFIIPTLNEEGVIEKTLKNLKGLKTIPSEIIISDGKSHDKTVDIAKKYTAEIIVYDGKVRQTIANGKNVGAAIANGEYLVFLDADVIIPELNTFFRNAVKIFRDDEKVAGITVSQKVLPEVETFFDKIIFKIVNFTHFLNNNILKIGSSSGECQMVKTKIFKNIGGFNESLAVFEDNDLFMRMAKSYRTKMIKNLTISKTSSINSLFASRCSAFVIKIISKV